MIVNRSATNSQRNNTQLQRPGQQPIVRTTIPSYKGKRVTQIVNILNRLIVVM
uniref:Uncharacterized protein n=1 Tax=Arundo donax TaxID=35708 RepID=A0A0A8XSN0_ARUDO